MIDAFTKLLTDGLSVRASRRPVYWFDDGRLRVQSFATLTGVLLCARRLQSGDAARIATLEVGENYESVEGWSVRRYA